MTRRRWIYDDLVAASVLALFAAACEGGGPEAMTQDEAAAVLEMVGITTVGPLVELSGGLANQRGGATDDRGQGGRSREGEFERQRECPEGGTVVVSGTIRAEGDRESRTMQMQVSTEFDDCTRTNREDITLTLDGTVAQELTKTTTYREDVVTIEMDGTWTGRVAWEKPDEDESGVCEIDVTMDVDIVIDRENRNRKVEGGVSGTACGVEVHTRKMREWLSVLW